MQAVIRYAVLASLLGLTGCTADTKYTQGKARKIAEESCAKTGKRFLEIEKIDRGGMFGMAGVSGDCVEIDDPRLARP